MSSRWETFLCPLSGLTADEVSVHHAVTLVHLPHVSVIVLYSGRFQSVLMLITEITFSWRMIYVHQHVYVPFVLRNHHCEVTPHPSLNVTHYSFRFFLKPSGIHFWFSLTVPLHFTVLVCKSSNKSKGRKKNVSVEFMPYSLKPWCKSCHSCMSRCDFTSCMGPVFAWVHSHVICISL